MRRLCIRHLTQGENNLRAFSTPVKECKGLGLPMSYYSHFVENYYIT